MRHQLLLTRLAGDGVIEPNLDHDTHLGMGMAVHVDPMSTVYRESMIVYPSDLHAHALGNFLRGHCVEVEEWHNAARHDVLTGLGVPGPSSDTGPKRVADLSPRVSS